MLDKAKAAAGKIAKKISGTPAAPRTVRQMAQIKTMTLNGDGSYNATVNDNGEEKMFTMPATDASGLTVGQKVSLIAGADGVEKINNPQKTVARNSPIGITIPAIRY